MNPHTAAPGAERPPPSTPPRLEGAALLARGPWSGAAPFALFLFVLTAAVTTRAWRLVDLVLGEAAPSTLLWLPLLVGRDLLLALTVSAIAVALVSVRVPALVAVTSAGAIAVAAVLWRSANVLCYRVLQGPITLPRLTGNEGARAKDIDLLEWRDISPIVLLGVVLVATLPLVVHVARRVHPEKRTALLVGALVLGGALTTVDSLWLRRFNFGLSDEPVAVFLESCLPAMSTPPAVELPEDPLALEVARTPAVGVDTVGIERSAPTVKNVIVFFAEGIPREYTGLSSMDAAGALSSGGAYADTTPNLVRRAQRAGLELERYYSPFHKSILAIFSYVCSEWPPPSGRNITLFNPRIDCGELSEIVSSWGIHAGLFHAGEFAFYDKLALLGARGYEIQKDAVDLHREGAWEGSTWGIDDRAMVQSTLAWIDSLPPDDRFVASLITLSPHYPYTLPSDVPIEADDDSEGDRFLAALRFLDVVFEELMVGLEARGLADDTAVIFVADHGENIWEPLRQSPGRRLAYDSNLHVPFVIFAPKMFPARQVSARPGSHVDLAPTILDLLGLPPVPQHRGQSLLSPEWQEKRIFFGALNGLDNYVGFMDGFDKVIVNRATGAAERYDLKKDPEELNDLFDEDRDQALVTDAIAFFDAQMKRIADAPQVSERLDTDRLVAEHARVSIVRLAEDGSALEAAPCVDGVCPGMAEPMFLGERELRVSGKTRTCVAVRVPPAGHALELALDDKATIPLLTYLRFGIGPVGVRPSGAVYVSAVVDGGEPKVARITRSTPTRLMRFGQPDDDLVLRVTGEPFDGLVCLSFSMAGWK